MRDDGERGRARSGGARGAYAKSAQKAEDIVLAATAVFAARGYHGGSVRDIARAVGTSTASISHHFSSKQHLLEAVLDRLDHAAAGERSAAFESACADTGLVAAIIARARAAAERPELVRMQTVLAAEAATPSHPAHAWFAARYRRRAREMADAVEFDQQQGRIDRTRDPRDLAALLIAAWDGAQLRRLAEPELDLETAMRWFFAWAVPESLAAGERSQPR